MDDSLGDRMKGYEAVSSHLLTRRTPVIVRVDGRAFHTLTRGADKPFDHKIISRMQESAFRLFDEMQGCKLGYVQSDEASFLLTDWDKINTDPWFGYDLSKVVSIAAATMSVAFGAVFDARAFNIPKEEVTNYFLWRAKDWARNSVQMLARANFSQKQLHEKSIREMRIMLLDMGLDWDDCSDVEKYGTFLTKGKTVFVPPNYFSVSTLVDPLLKEQPPVE